MHLYQIMSVAVFNRSNCLTYIHEFFPSSCVLSVSCLKPMAPAGALGQNIWVKQAHMWYHPVVFGKTILWEACCTKTWPSISHSSGPHNYDDPLCTAAVLENASIHSLWLPSDVPSLPCGVKGQCKGGQHNGHWESKNICHHQKAQFVPFPTLYPDLLPLISFVIESFQGHP